jgi:hypothetical protein
MRQVLFASPLGGVGAVRAPLLSSRGEPWPPWKNPLRGAHLLQECLHFDL